MDADGSQGLLDGFQRVALGSELDDLVHVVARLAGDAPRRLSRRQCRDMHGPRLRVAVSRWRSLFTRCGFLFRVWSHCAVPVRADTGQCCLGSAIGLVCRSLFNGVNFERAWGT